jgi:hypothetical protein
MRRKRMKDQMVRMKKWVDLVELLELCRKMRLLENFEVHRRWMKEEIQRRKMMQRNARRNCWMGVHRRK